MKKIKLVPAFLIVTGFVVWSNSAYAQSYRNSHGDVTPVQVGTTVVNVGIGLGADYRGDSYGTGFGFKVAAEVGLWQAGPGVITLGPEIGGSFSPGGYNGNDYRRANTFIIAGRSAWHYGWQIPGLDTYGGLSAGIGFHRYYNDINSDYNNTVIPALGGFVGASYFISPQFGFNAEAGYDITNFQVGVVLKLK